MARPESHQAHCVVKGKGPRRDQCRKLAKAMACGDEGHCATPLTPQTVQGNAGGKNEGLCICRQRLIFGGTIFANAQGPGTAHRMPRQKFALSQGCQGRFTQHANTLGALAWENKSYAVPGASSDCPAV